jgi:cystathionine beta-lyase family protein involved in aluminum resistance
MEIFVAGRMTLAIRSSTMMVWRKRSKGYSARYSKIIKRIKWKIILLKKIQ